jgi:hypothetical protein
VEEIRCQQKGENQRRDQREKCRRPERHGRIMDSRGGRSKRAISEFAGHSSRAGIRFLRAGALRRFALTRDRLTDCISMVTKVRSSEASPLGVGVYADVGFRV